MKLCVIIPVYNEAKTVGRVVRQVREYQLDVLVVDDGSTDASSAEAQSAGARVLRNDCKHGKGYTLQKGFEYALAEGYDGVLTIDGDGQHDPADLRSFLPAIERQPYSLVTGNRMADVRQMPFVRRLTNWIMSGLISRICRVKIPDSQCGYRYLSRQTLQMLNLQTQEYEIETEILIQSSRMGIPIISVPVQTIYQDEESHIRPFKDTLRFFLYLYRVARHSAEAAPESSPKSGGKD